MNITVTSDAYSAAVAVADVHAALCREMLSIIFCAPAPGLAAAKRNGVTDAIFLMHRDLWLIWTACKYAAQNHEDNLSAVSAAVMLLRAESCGEWTVAKVCGLAESYSTFPSPMQALDVRLCAARLKECHAALLTVDRSSRQTERALRRVLGRKVA